MDFFTDPWSMQLATWTLKEIFSALIQIGLAFLTLILLLAIIGRN